MRTAIVLACCHPAVATHESGGRLIKCGECDLTSIVQAKPVKMIEYQISPLHESLTFDDVKVSDPDDIA